MTDTKPQETKSIVLDYISFYINGKEVLERAAEPDWTLLWYLRNKLNLLGSKLSCGEGGCGSCTVLVSRCIDRDSSKVEHRIVNACLAPLCSVEGCHVVTVEGLGSVNKSNLHPVQVRLADLSGSQCGFCTPGMVMSLYGTIASKVDSIPTLQDIEDAFDGNLCRCTGYRPILDAAKTFASDLTKLPCSKSSSKTSTTLDKCLSYTKQNLLSFPQIEFPQKLLNHISQSIHIQGDLIDWYRPVSLTELLHLRQCYPGDASNLICGNTHVEIERKFKQLKCYRLIATTHIDELQQLKRTANSLVLGAGVTFTQLKSKLFEWKNENSDNNSEIFQALLDQLKYFASNQIRNVASLGGHIVAASPNSDINPVLQAADAKLEMHSAQSDAARYVLIRDFYLDDHRIDMANDEVLVAIHIPLHQTASTYFLRSYKQARRRDGSRGIVSAGLQIRLNQRRIVSACFSFGGVASKIVMATNTQRELVGQLWTKQTINKACESILKEIQLDEFSPGGQIEYRKTLIQSFIFKFYTHVCSELCRELIDSTHLSAGYPYHRPLSHGQQILPERLSSQKVVGSSLPHRSSYLHTTGEAVYTDDIPLLANTLHAALVLSKEPNARIKHVDLKAASKMAGFVSFVNHADVPGSNKTGAYVQDEEVFVSLIAPCIGAIIGVVVCETEQAARIASNLIEIEYELLTPTILTIEDAIANESYLGDEQYLRKGDVEIGFAEAEHILEDSLMIGGQEHFYMETNSYVVIPSDDKELTLYLGTQNPSATQELVARALGRDASHIMCHVKRIGGGFGGKETRGIFPCIAISVAAVKTGRPVRLSMERETDICVTGHRHPFKIDYKVAFTEKGHFSALDVRMWSNAGYSEDVSLSVMQMAMLHMCNTYQYHNVQILGRVCKTHLPSNTAFRGFGGPQAMLASETIVEHVAAHMKLDPLVVRHLNIHKEGDLTHHGQLLEQWNIPRILDELIQSSDFVQRQKLVEQFNQAHAYRKRGLCLIPNKFGIGFPYQSFHQAGSLVHIYKDGSVLLTHGGVEMGQGLHTKMIAIAAEVLGCSADRVRISETSTDRVPNMSATSGSVSSDLNGMAVRHACEQLRERLNTFSVGDKLNLVWEDLVKQAYFARIDLSAHGFYATPDMFDADFAKCRAYFNYYTQGAAVTEVELDTLTGDWHLLRVDILMDVGRSLNPQIDVGQIEGAFMQGVGMFTIEELIWGDSKWHKWIKPGELFTRGPSTYKIPSFSDVPLDMRISLLSDSTNPRAVYSSKGIGEPPLLLAASVFFALKQACMAYRQQQGISEYFTLHSPATVERLRMACADEFTRRACPSEHHTFQSRGCV